MLRKRAADGGKDPPSLQQQQRVPRRNNPVPSPGISPAASAKSLGLAVAVVSVPTKPPTPPRRPSMDDLRDQVGRVDR